MNVLFFFLLRKDGRSNDRKQPEPGFEDEEIIRKLYKSTFLGSNKIILKQFKELFFPIGYEVYFFPAPTDQNALWCNCIPDPDIGCKWLSLSIEEKTPERKACYYPPGRFRKAKKKSVGSIKGV